MAVAYRSSAVTVGGAGNGDVSGSTLAATKPAGVQEGDLLVAIVARSQTSAGVTEFTASGWSEAAFYAGSGSTPNRPVVAVMWKAAGASEPSSYTFTSVGFSGLDQFSCHMLALTGADLADPFIAGPSVENGTGSSASVVAPSLTLPSAGMLVCWFSVLHWPTPDPTFSTPSGMTERIDNDPCRWLQVATSTESRSSGSTGTRSATYSAGSQSTRRGISFAIGEGITADPPTVDAGADATITAGQEFTRTASENDGGATITARQWEIVSVN